MKRHTVILLVFGLLLAAALFAVVYATPGRATSEVAAMSAANNLVEAGHYEEAIQLYQQLGDRDVHDSALFFNLGNAYHQQGDLQQAIASYQQALRLAPRDRDIRHNLALAQADAGDMGLVMQQPQGPLASLVELTRRWLTLDELALLALYTWFALGFLVVAGRQYSWKQAPALLRYGTRLSLLLVALTSLALASRTLAEPAASHGIMVIEQLAGFLQISAAS